ncbi:MAG: sigma-54 dependent transcriptional regulator [Bdellovibrionaceae bacterium]|nr:sigma-54 dependent transcriptional regulator [Pseudobdellovibrionaceae bacterium]
MAQKIKNLVVVDDDADIRELISAFFKQKGYVVTCYEDAETALKASQTKGEEWDVLLTDLRLPIMSGVELTVAVKKYLPHLPVILITTSKSAEVAVEAVKKGAYDFIVKPIHFPQLQISVERAMHLKELSHNLVDLREKVKNPTSIASNIIGKSPKFLAAIDIARRVAKSKANIYISGESGTGKEVFAKFIHAEGGRAKGPFVAINCSAIPENLLESELFGHAKGSFTGAQDKKVGLFEEAENGTLFLDEIGDLSLQLQAKLLRVLQEKKIKRVGENQYRPINCRVISATHKDLVSEIQQGRFREDLYFRLNVIPILIPPLRERKEDLIPLAEAFLKRFALENDSPAKSFSKEALKLVLENPWRGNVRELENAVERAVVLASESEISMENMTTVDHMMSHKNEPGETTSAPNGADYFAINCETGLPHFEDVMNKFIEFAVARNNGARDRTAKEIGIDRKTLYKRLRTTADQ